MFNTGCTHLTIGSWSFNLLHTDCCNIVHAIYSMQCISCNKWHAIYYMQLMTCNILHWYIIYSFYSLKTLTKRNLYIQLVNNRIYKNIYWKVKPIFSDPKKQKQQKQLAVDLSGPRNNFCLKASLSEEINWVQTLITTGFL